MVKKITAIIGGHYANVEPHRPSWQDMKKYYPADGVTKYIFYPKISKALGNDADKPAYRNTCALRMSYALTHSGMKLKRAPSIGGNILGDDHKNYWLRVSDLKKELRIKFGSPDFYFEFIKPEIDMTVIQFHERVAKVKAGMISKIQNKNGIVVFHVLGWPDASGHFTLWEGATNNLFYVGDAQIEKNPSIDNPMYYFWRVPNSGSPAWTHAISFWELK